MSVEQSSVVLSDEAMAALRRMVAWRIAGAYRSLRQRDLDEQFGRSVWEEVAAAGLLKSEMYSCHSLTVAAVEMAMGWQQI